MYFQHRKSAFEQKNPVFTFILFTQMAQNEPPISVELPQEIAQGIYTNIASIAHSHAEFILDFIQLLPGTPKAVVKSRVITAPVHAKQLMLALKDNIERYEKMYGKIDLPSNQPPPPPMYGGGGPAGFA